MSANGLDRERLVKLLGMLGSNYDGERANAGRMASDMVRGADLTWPQILSPDTFGGSLLANANSRIAALSQENVRLREEIERLKQEAPRKPFTIECYREIEGFLDHAEYLTEWEHSFLESLLERCSPVSEKQTAVIERIRLKVWRFGRRTGCVR
jgi:hypothetical protein